MRLRLHQARLFSRWFPTIDKGLFMRTFEYLFIAILLLPSLSMAEPYAEWGVFADGTPLSEIDTSVTMPNAADVPIPLIPGAVFMGDVGDTYCTIALRTKVSVNSACDFYRSELDSSVYQPVKGTEIEGHESCTIFEDGDMENGSGVRIYEDTDPMFSLNGTTLIYLSYQPPAGKLCSH